MVPVPQENLYVVEQAGKPVADNGACSTRKFIFCGTGILPVAENGAKYQLKQKVPLRHWQNCCRFAS